MKGIDLFCGCGGLSLGFQNAGVRIAAAYDKWQPALDCYRLNFSHPASAADLTQVEQVAEKIAVYAPDIIIGGPPCQDFSSAGKRSEKENADLTLCYAKIVAAVHPKWFVMENVDRAQKSKTYAAARKIFKAAGYGLTEEVLNACHYGVPQSRRRFFCIGLLGVPDGFLANDLLLDKQEMPMTIKAYFEKIKVPVEVESYYRHPRSYKRRAVFSVDEPSPTIRGVNRPVPDGYQGHSGDRADARKVRPLTTRERSIIQTFPADFQLPQSKTVAEQLLGNAVPVALAQAVAGAIFTYNEMLKETKRGRKSGKENIAGVDRDLFMRWMVREGSKKAYAKDTWSWLQRAEPYIDEESLSEGTGELAVYLTRRQTGGKRAAPSSRMRKSLDYFVTLREKLSHSKNLGLDFYE